MARKPIFGPVRQEAWEAAHATKNAANKAAGVLDEASASLLRINAALMEAIAKTMEFVDDLSEGKIVLKATVEGNEIPISLVLEYDVKEDDYES